MTLSELRSWCNRESFADDKPVVIQIKSISDVDKSISVLLKDIEITSFAVIMKGYDE